MLTARSRDRRALARMLAAAQLGVERQRVLEDQVLDDAPPAQAQQLHALVAVLAAARARRADHQVRGDHRVPRPTVHDDLLRHDLDPGEPPQHLLEPLAHRVLAAPLAAERVLAGEHEARLRAELLHDRLVFALAETARTSARTIRLTISLYIVTSSARKPRLAQQAALGARAPVGEELLVGDAELERQQRRRRLALRLGRLDRTQLLGDAARASRATRRTSSSCSSAVSASREEELQRSLVAQLDVERLVRGEPVVQRALARRVSS